jgi:hypothetical protein
MQFTLAFLDQPDPPAAQNVDPSTWDQLDQASRIAALDILARLIAQMLTSRPEKVASND